MRVLTMVHSWPGRGPGYPEGAGHNAGAEMTAFELLRRLAQRGHEVHVLLSAQTGEPYELGGCHVWPHTGPMDPFRWFGDPANRPDLVITYLENTQRAAVLCQMHGVPLCHLVHNTFEYTKNAVARGPADLVTYHADWVRRDYEEFLTALELPIPRSHMVHPMVDPTIYGRGKVGPHDHVTLINVWPNKGAEVFYALAHAFPDQKFLGVTGGYGEQVIRELPNVEFHPHVPAERMPEQVYARTRVLLVPSVYESYGRVAVEAACAGVPVIAAPTPGLLEALGDDGVFVDHDDIQGWITALDKMLKPRPLGDARKRVLSVAARQTPIADADAWCAVAEEVAGHVGAATAGSAL